MKKIFALTTLLIAFFAIPALAETQSLFIEGDHGKLAAVLQNPDSNSKCPIVIICHGFMSKKDFPLLENLANDLEAAGIASIRFDFNGHGESEGRFQDMTVPNEIEDAKKVFNFVKDMNRFSSISIAGHSQGGVVSSMVAGELGADNIKAVALFAPAAVLRDDATLDKIGRKMWATRLTGSEAHNFVSVDLSKKNKQFLGGIKVLLPQLKI